MSFEELQAHETAQSRRGEDPPGEDWDIEVDWLVVGSGAAGMTSALIAHDLSARTLIIEKSGLYGGSTALSGGALWIPDNPLMRRLGIEDSREEALHYLEGITEGLTSRTRLDAYLDGANALVEYLEAKTQVKFTCLTEYPDYYPESAGGRPGARTIEPQAFDAMELGDEYAHQLQMEPYLFLMNIVSMTAGDMKIMLRGGWPMLSFLLKDFFRWLFHFRARLRWGLRTTILTLGSSLIGRLRASLLDRDVPLWRDCPLAELIQENGRVIGAVARREGRPVRIRAHKGVLLAAGGYERNAALRKRVQPAPTGDQWALGCESNTGDTIDLGVAVGASIELMDEAWWCPVFKADDGAPHISVVEKGMPNSIMVNSRGERFMNEAAPYNDVVKSMYANHQPETAASIPCYMIFDRSYRMKRPCGALQPGYSMPDWSLPPSLRSFLYKGRTLRELAEKLGIDANGLEASVARYNGMCPSGQDLDFGRGSSAQDRFYSDPYCRPNPCMGPVETAPFYAVKIFPGDLGTKGGFRTDEHGRVLRENDEAIPGLYAAGNASASIMGRSYPGAGGTIGPAMTFGYVAARHAIEAKNET